MSSDQGSSDPQYQHEMRVWEKKLDSRAMLFQGVIAFATLAIKSLLLFNGGAVLALLTFFGNVIARSGTSALDAKQLGVAITCFLAGVGTGLFCAMAAYLAQIAFTELDEKPAIFWGNSLRVIAFLAATISFASFVAGSLQSISVLESLSVIPKAG